MTPVNKITNKKIYKPISKGLVCSSVLRNCEMNIGGESMTMDLIPLSMSHFDVIIGMDWLSKHKAKIDCTQRQIIFEKAEERKPI